MTTFQHPTLTETPHLTLDPDFYDENGVFYPDTDEEGMPEGDLQLDCIVYAINVLRFYFKHFPDVYVSGDKFIYYDKGQRRSNVAPDILVAFGVTKRSRPSYQVWKEGKSPDFVLEVTSQSTHKKDDRNKPAIYHQLGVREYFQYDPTGEYLHPGLQGYQLNAQGVYQPASVHWLPNGVLSLSSVVLHLDFHLDDTVLRVFDPQHGMYLETYDETKERADHEAQARQQAETRAEQAEERIAREARDRQELEDRMKALQAEMDRLKRNE